MIALNLVLDQSEPCGKNRFVAMRGPHGQHAMVAFTDQGLAERFKQSTPAIARFALTCAVDAKGVLDLLATLERNGYTDVAFDSETQRTLYCPIANVRQEFAAGR
jgi:hypothetical protein